VAKLITVYFSSAMTVENFEGLVEVELRVLSELTLDLLCLFLHENLVLKQLGELLLNASRRHSSRRKLPIRLQDFLLLILLLEFWLYHSLHKFRLDSALLQ
jgi:hypothetical protein